MSIGSLPFSLRDVVEEIYGVGFSGTKSLYDCHTDADPAVTGGSTVKLSYFAGHTQNWGRAYSQVDISYTAYMRRNTEGTYYLMNGSETLEWTGDRDEAVTIYKSGTGTPITAGEGIRVRVYTRAKQTAGAWGLVGTFNNYASTSLGTFSFTVSDYKCILDNTP